MLSRRSLLSALSALPFAPLFTKKAAAEPILPSVAVHTELAKTLPPQPTRIVVPSATPVESPERFTYRVDREGRKLYDPPFELQLHINTDPDCPPERQISHVLKFHKMLVQFDVAADPRDLTFPGDDEHPLVYAMLTDVEATMFVGGNGQLTYQRLWGPRNGLWRIANGVDHGWTMLGDYFFDKGYDEEPRDIMPVEMLTCGWMTQAFHVPHSAFDASLTREDRAALRTRVVGDWGMFSFQSRKTHKELEFDWGRDV